MAISIIFLFYFLLFSPKPHHNQKPKTQSLIQKTLQWNRIINSIYICLRLGFFLSSSPLSVENTLLARRSLPPSISPSNHRFFSPLFFSISFFLQNILLFLLCFCFRRYGDRSGSHRDNRTARPFPTSLRCQTFQPLDLRGCSGISFSLCLPVYFCVNLFSLSYGSAVSYFLCEMSFFNL